MRRAISLARKGLGWVSPNPLVGAVLVMDGRIIGEGFHRLYGGPHAEAEAIMNATESIAGSTLYVTLEPCNHHGKTPPCTVLIIEKKIRRVVFGISDPNPTVSGGGAAFLAAHGVEVASGLLEKEIRRMNEVFIRFVTTGKPFVLLKSAMTLDGKIATVTNASRWITGPASRNKVHHLRHEISAVMVGVDTVIYDDPLLNVRLGRGHYRNPYKIIADTNGRTPQNASVLQNEPHLTIVAAGESAPRENLRRFERMGAQVVVCPLKDGRIDLVWLMGALGAMGIDSVMIEGGSTLAFSAIAQGIVDKLLTFIAPRLLGGSGAPTPLGGTGLKTMEEAVELKDVRSGTTGNDLWVEGYVVK